MFCLFLISALKKKLHILSSVVFFLIALCNTNTIVAQPLPTFNMLFQEDTTVENCKGILYDNGGPGTVSPAGDYRNNSRDTFRICTGGTISLSILQFATEPGWDSIFFYDGMSIGLGSQIGAYTGTGPVPVIVANSGCLTIVFRSSTLVAEKGFKAQWTSVVVPPVPPTFSISPTPSCSTTTIKMKFNRQIHCDSIYPAALQITGPITTSVSSVVPIGCSPDSTDEFDLNLTTMLDQSCNYGVNLTFKMLDNCDSVWIFNVVNTFTITDCPIIITINPTPNDSICAGSCVQLQSVVNGCLSYNYFWSHGLSNSPTQNVCPTGTTTYTLGVQSTLGGPIFSGSITITIIQPTINPPALNPVCQSEPAFNLTASPPGGIWSGPGIIRPNGRVTGTFDPDTAGPGTHNVVYTIGGLCSTTLQITVIPMDAGIDDAACLGSAPFSVSSYTPTGGTWSGGSGLISPAGTFTPSIVGTFTVTYTHPNGCSDTKLVFVNNGISLNPLNDDTLCESVVQYTFTASPPGGRWVQAAGIEDTVFGVYNPGAAGPGAHKYVYKLNGCEDTLYIYIKPANIGNSFVVCPMEPSDTFGLPNPLGGYWQSIYVSNGGASVLTNTNVGIYNPGSQGITNFNDHIVYYAPNGCTDSLWVWVRKTNLNKDSIFFCLGTDSMRLNTYSNTQYDPSGGVWTGPGVAKYGSNYFFRPYATGKGVYTLTYTANTCFDTIKMIVYPPSLGYEDTTVCSTNPPFIIDPSIGINAIWQGTGITNAQTGLFDPSITGAGTFPVVYMPNGGCRDTIDVTVYSFQAAYLGNLNTIYCANDTNFTLSLTPANGTLTINGTQHINNFNPDSVGPGNHTFIYSFGAGTCFTSDTINVTIYPPLQTTISATKDTICNGGGSTISILSTGGNPFVTSHTYNWSNGLFPTSVNVVTPSTTTTYYITTSDGCSDAITDSITIHIFPPFNTTFSTSNINCYGTSGTASVAVSGTGNYVYSWSTRPVQSTSSITGLSGVSYYVKITDANSGCFYDTVIKIPGYGIIKSLFSSNPNLPCIPYDQNTITFIDLSLGATQGYWVANGDTIPYVPGVNPQFSFTEPGTYPIKLVVMNEGNCDDEYSLEICILDPTKIFMPDIFSPNGDGLNDIFYVRGGGITELQFIIYDRWGMKIFETTDPYTGWDGTINGAPAMPGMYVWHLNVTMNDGSSTSQKGDITLIR